MRFLLVALALVAVRAQTDAPTGPPTRFSQEQLDAWRAAWRNRQRGDNGIAGVQDPAECGEPTTGQCCGSDFCARDIIQAECEETLGGIWNESMYCNTTCRPEQTGQSADGSTVTIVTDISNAGSTLDVNARIDVAGVNSTSNFGITTDIVSGGDIFAPITAFTLVHTDGDGIVIEGNDTDALLAMGSYLEVTIYSTSFAADEPIIVWRLATEKDPDEWVTAESDCVAAGTAYQIDPVPAAGLMPFGWTTRICHTSLYAITSAGDGADSHAKVPKKGKPSKGAKAAKEAKAKGGKKAGKGKLSVAVAAGVGGVAAAGVLVIAGVVIKKRRANNAKKPAQAVATAPNAVHV